MTVQVTVGATGAVDIAHVVDSVTVVVGITVVDESVQVSVCFTVVRNTIGVAVVARAGGDQAPAVEDAVVTAGAIRSRHRPGPVGSLAVEVSKSSRTGRLHRSTSVVIRSGVRYTTIVISDIDVIGVTTSLIVERNDGTRRTLECEEDVTVPAVADINADIQIADGETRSADQDIDSWRQGGGNRSTRGAALFHRDRKVADIGQAVAVTVTGTVCDITGVQRSVAVTVGGTAVRDLALVQNAVEVAVGGYRCCEAGSQYRPVDQRTVVTSCRIHDGHRPVTVPGLTVEVRQGARSRRLHHGTCVVGRSVRNTIVVECRIDVGSRSTTTVMQPD